MKSFSHYKKITTRYLDFFGLIGLYYLFLAIVLKVRWIVPISRKWANGHPIWLRLNSSDISVFSQVFIEEEYAVLDKLSVKNGEILDAGANIGLTSIWLSQKFPDKKIFAIEPDLANYGLLCLNISGIDRVIPGNFALWGDEIKSLFIPRNNSPAWGKRTHPINKIEHQNTQEVSAIRIDDFMTRHGIETISILKMDVEGAELNIFEKNPHPWIEQVESIVLELHEYAAPGCTQAFQHAIASHFKQIATTYELILVSR